MKQGLNRKPNRVFIARPRRERQHLGWGLQCVTFFWLVGGEVTGWCSRNLELSLKLPSSTWGGVGVWVQGRGRSLSEELKDTVMLAPRVGTRTLPQGCPTTWLFLPCFCILSLPWLATVWICPLELSEGQGGWMKPITYKWEMANTERICTREPHGFLLRFSSLFDTPQSFREWDTNNCGKILLKCLVSIQGLDTELEMFLSSRYWILVSSY